MIQKGTQLIPIDKTGVYLVNTFHLYQGGRRKIAHVSNFIKTSVRVVNPESILPKKKKTLALVINTKFRVVKNDGSLAQFFENHCILLKRKLVFRNKDITFPGSRTLKRKKLMFKFPGIL